MTSKQPAVYMMASGERGTLYIGVTGNLRLRVWEHRDGVVDGFTTRYGVKRLVWFEFHADFVSAVAREKQLKKWNRAWKMELIESGNPQWRDLWQEIGVARQKRPRISQRRGSPRPSFPRKRESNLPLCAVKMDSRFRGNDGRKAERREALRSPRVVIIVDGERRQIGFPNAWK